MEPADPLSYRIHSEIKDDMSVEDADAAALENMLQHIDAAHRQRFLEIIALTDEYCLTQLAPLGLDYQLVSRFMASVLCSDGSPIVKGKVSSKVWAAAIVASIGFVNFLSDPDTLPFKTTKDLAADFGVSVSQLQTKSRQIRKLLDLVQFDPNWTVPGLMIENPLIWMIETPSGFVIDARTLPREKQIAAYEADLIPFVPDDEMQRALEFLEMEPEDNTAPPPMPEIVARIGPMTGSTSGSTKH